MKSRTSSSFMPKWTIWAPPLRVISRTMSSTGRLSSSAMARRSLPCHLAFLALPLGVLGIAGDANALAADVVVDAVLDALLHLGADLRVVEALDHVLG